MLTQTQRLGSRVIHQKSAIVLVILAIAWPLVAGCSRSAPPPPPVAQVPDREANPPEAMPAGAPESGLPFSVPSGYEAEQVAGPPLVQRPMFACFDDQGRLFVAGSSGHNLSGNELLAHPMDVIRCLEDTDGDGHFDKSSVFADHLTYPQGVLWHDGAIYTASPPSLWRLEDTDGDGVADRRQELITGFPFTGIADDLHGPCLGPDGRIYWGVGRFDYAIRRPDGPVIRQGQTPLIMRCRPDGEAVEVFSAAMGNPVEVAFSPEGEPFACGTFLSPEAQGEGLRDAIIHCVYGGLYAVRDRGLAAEKRTGDLLPPMAQLGVAAGSGMMIARGRAFGDESHPALYAALFNLHSVPRFVLERDGATFRAREEPFLVSEVADFHPTDVLEDADGSLLVVDTGGWFRSCPTSQVDKPDVQGGIYRIRRAGASGHADPWGRQIDWDRQPPRALARMLHDRRFMVRDRAAAELVRLGEKALPTLRRVLRDAPERVRRRAVWVLARIDGPGARAATRTALNDSREGVRQVAASAVGLHRDGRARDDLVKLLDADSLALRREAATALGRLGRSETVPRLLDGLRKGPDRYLEHALIYALIRIDDRGATLPGLSDPSPSVRRGALIALDQMAGGRLDLAQVSPFLDADEPALRQAALRVVAGHPEWAGPMAETLGRWLARGAGQAPLVELRRQLLAFSKNPEIQGVITDALARPETPAEIRVMLLEVIAAAEFEEWPKGWPAVLRKSLTDRDERVARQAVSAVPDSVQFGLESALLALARDRTRGADLRIEALEAAAPRLKEIEPALFEYLASQLRLEEMPLRRLAAARALGRAPLDDGELLALTRAVGDAGAMTLPLLLPAFERSQDRKVGNALVAALGRSPGLRSLTAPVLQRTFRNYSEEVRHLAEPLFQKIEVDEGEKGSRLAEVLPLLSQGDPARGHEVFFGTRAACSTCHTVRGEGGHVGPDLSRIGAARSGRDLLEAILFPSASFARGYEPFVIATDDGRVETGVIHRETAEAIVLVTAGRVELTIPRRSIEAIEPSRVSLMPRGLDANLSQQELIDLVAFLESLF